MFVNLAMMLLLLLCFVTSQGLLLDTITQLPKAGTVLTDSHFSMLLNLLVEERNSRERLERTFKQHQQELTIMNSKLNNCYCNKPDLNINEINNVSAQFEDNLKLLNETIHSLEVSNGQLEQRQTKTENITGLFEKEIKSLQQLKSVSDLKTISELRNKTNQLEFKQQKNEYTLQSIVSSANARSQDFLALLKKIEINDNVTLYLRKELQNTNSRLSVSVSNITATLNTNLKIIQSNLESSITNVTKLSNKVGFTAYCSVGSIGSSAIIPYTTIHTSNGIGSLSTVRSNGQFTCDKSGFYLIIASLSSVTHSVDSHIGLYKNGDRVALAYLHSHTYAISVTVFSLERLNVNDRVYVRNEGRGLSVGSGSASTFTVVQID